MELKSRDIVQFGVNVNVEKKCKYVQVTIGVKAIALVNNNHHRNACSASVYLVGAILRGTYVHVYVLVFRYM